MKTKYLIQKANYVQFRILREEDLGQITPGCTFAVPDVDPETISVYEDVEIAQQEMQHHETSLRALDAYAVAGRLVLVTEYFLVEATYDEDDEDCTWAVDYEALAFSPIPEGTELRACGAYYQYSAADGWQKQPEEEEEE